VSPVAPVWDDTAVGCCPKCSADVVAAVATAPGFEGVEVPTCSDGCGWVGQP